MAETKARFLANTQKADTTAEAWAWPDGRATEDNHVLSFKDKETGETEWKAVAVAPTISAVTWYSDSSYSTVLPTGQEVNINPSPTVTSGTLGNGTTEVTLVTTTNLNVGDGVSGTGINSGVTIASIDTAGSSNDGTITLSATNAGTGSQSLTFTPTGASISYLKVGGADFGDSGVFGNTAYVQIINTSQSSVVVGDNSSGLTGCVTAMTHVSSAEWKFTINPTGVSNITAGDVLKVKVITNGGNDTFTSGYTVSADPTSTTTVSSAVVLNTASVGSFGGLVTGGGEDADTKLLLNFDRGGGADFEDSSNIGGDGHKVTATNALIKASPFGDGKSAMYFNYTGSNHHIEIADSTDLDLGTSMMVEAWIYLDNANAERSLMSHGGDGSSGVAGWDFRFQGSGGYLRFNHHDGGSSNPYFRVKHNFSASEWHHVAVSNDGTTFRMFLDGKMYVLADAESGSTNLTASTPASSSPMIIGRYHSDGGHWSGYIDEVRIVNGAAVYTSDFTPRKTRLDSSAEASTTKLLISGGTTNGASWNTTASTSNDYGYQIGPSDLTVSAATHSTGHGGIATAMPFATSRKTHGSAGCYFDGENGTKLTVSDFSPFGDGVFTLDFWVYNTDRDVDSSNSFIFDGGDSNDGAGFLIQIDRTNGQLIINDRTDSNAVIIAGSSDTVLDENTWTHIAVVRSSNTLKLYLNGAEKGSSTNNSNFSSDLITLGRYRDGDNYNFEGYIDSFRASVGIARTLDSTDQMYISDGTSFTVPTNIYGVEGSLTINSIGLAGVAGADSGDHYVIYNTATLSGSTESTVALPSGLSISPTVASLASVASTGNAATISGDLTATAGTHAIKLVASVSSDGKTGGIDPNRKTAYTHTITKNAGGLPEFSNARRYVGNDLARDITGYGFKPDLVWFKEREDTNWHQVFDSVRGGHSAIYPNATNAKGDRSGSEGYITSFNSDGFSLSTDTGNSGINQTGAPMIAWGWKAGGEVGSDGGSQTHGYFRLNGETTDRAYNTYTVPAGSGYAHGKSMHTGGGGGTTFKSSYNTNAGITITETTSVGNATWNTFPNLLGGGADMVIIKRLDAAGGWNVWHKDSPEGVSNYRGILQLDQDISAGSNNDRFGSDDAMPGDGARTYTIGSNDTVNASTSTARYIHYIFRSVTGVSHFGEYVGTGNNTAMTTEASSLGFRPRFLMIKNASNAGSWIIMDVFRNGTSETVWYKNLRADNADAEDVNSGAYSITINANGFQLPSVPSVTGNLNSSGDTYVYAAFA